MQIAYNPQNNSLYVPFHDQCLSMTATSKSKTGFGPRVGVMRPGSDPQQVHEHRQDRCRDRRDEGDLLAAAGRPTARLVTTAGDLVFLGDLNRRVRALDADDGKVLWESVVGGMVMVSTITYAVNGKQYVMVFTGEGQSLTNNVLTLTKDVMPTPVRDSGIYVFALP